MIITTLISKIFKFNYLYIFFNNSSFVWLTAILNKILLYISKNIDENIELRTFYDNLLDFCLIILLLLVRKM